MANPDAWRSGYDAWRTMNDDSGFEEEHEHCCVNGHVLASHWPSEMSCDEVDRELRYLKGHCPVCEEVSIANQ
jgi:hypothetical protein